VVGSGGLTAYLVRVYAIVAKCMHTWALVWARQPQVPCGASTGGWWWQKHAVRAEIFELQTTDGKCTPLKPRILKFHQGEGSPSLHPRVLFFKAHPMDCFSWHLDERFAR
jgi:hypothetical protein